MLNRWSEFTVERRNMEADYDWQFGMDDEEMVMGPAADRLTKDHLTYKW